MKRRMMLLGENQSAARSFLEDIPIVGDAVFVAWPAVEALSLDEGALFGYAVKPLVGAVLFVGGNVGGQAFDVVQTRTAAEHLRVAV